MRCFILFEQIMKVTILFALLTIFGHCYSQGVYKSQAPLAHTYSIVARDSSTGELAIGVQSHWFSVGTAVPWAKAGVGAVATQSFVDKSYGPKGLALLEQGFTAQQALDTLLKADVGRDVRQVAIVDSRGNVATHTGSKCIAYAAHITGNGFSVQSNMMLGNNVNKSMYAAYVKAAGKPIAERVLLAMEADEVAGGDIRGKQAAAIIVVKGDRNDEPWNDRTVDLRIDDHTVPLKELRRLYNVHLAYLHMNNGDLAVEKNDMQLAMQEYNAAMKMFPGNLEMQYWTAITLANNKQLSKAMPMLKKIFIADKNWKELTRRLPITGLLNVSAKELQAIMSL